METEYTTLPFYNNFTAAKLFAATAIVLILFLIVRAIIAKRSLTVHRAPFAAVTAYINAAIINILLCTFLYWYWALPLCLVISLIYMFTTANEIKDANSEERAGVWGLNRDIRRIRCELFNDLPIEEQLKLREKVVPYKFRRGLFVIITMLVPLLFILICDLTLDYLYYPVIIE